MKNKTLLAVIMITTLAVACNSGSNDVDQQQTSDVPFIHRDSANKMIQSYLSSISADTTDTVNRDLYSLIMDAHALREYLADTSIKTVKLMFAHTLGYINSGHSGQPAGYKSGALTLVFAGINSSGDYVYYNTDFVANQAVPCPRNCPTVGTALHNLLQ